MSELAAAEVEKRPRRLVGRGRPPISVTLAALVVLVVAVAAVAGRAVAPSDPDAQNLLLGLTPPGPGHMFGTDELGRDIAARTIAGARTAALGPLLVALGSMAIGNLLGLLAGYLGGWIDSVIMRWVDLVYALPGLLVAIVVVGVVGGGYWLAVALLAVLFSPVDTRIVRAAALEQRALPYVEAARTLGLRTRRIMFRHIWPNVLPLAVANAFLTFAFALVSLSALSFLGLGVAPGTPDWGWMLSDSRNLLFDNPAAAIAPGTALVLTATCVNLLGDWLFEGLSGRGR